MLAIMLVFQFALYQHASHVVASAAQRGAVEAQAERGSTGGGRRGAAAVLTQSGRGLLRSPQVRVSRGRNRTRVVVRADVVSLIPGFRAFSVTGIADGPTERFWAETER